MNLETLQRFNSLSLNGSLGDLSESFYFTDEPKFPQYSCYKGNPDSGGTSVDIDEEKAKVKACGEFLERTCLDYDKRQSPELVKMKFNENTGKCVDPAAFVNFREQDMGWKRRDYISMLRESELNWILGKDELNGRDIFIPAQQVFVDYPFNEPLIRPRISTGAATAESFDDALIGGVLENIERDAYMISYLSKRNLSKIELEGELKKLEEYFRRYLIELNVFDMRTDIDIPSYLCVAVDRTGLGPAISVGLKTGFDENESIKGAILEAHQIRQWVRYQHGREGKLSPNSNNITSEKERGFFWYYTKKISDLDFLLNHPETIKIGQNTKRWNKKSLLNYLKDKEIRIFSVDITYPVFREAGFFVAKAVQPELHPLFLDERFPCYESERLSKFLGDGEVNSIPHPFI